MSHRLYILQRPEQPLHHSRTNHQEYRAMFVVEEALKLLFKTIAPRFLQALVILAIMTILAGKNINLQMDAITLLQNACLLVGTYISFHVISTILIRIVVIPKFSSHKPHVQTTIKRVGDL